MKKFALLFLVGILSTSLKAQVGGLSASKLGTLCTETVPLNAIEFEPAFSFSSATHFFDSNGEIQPLFSTSDSTLKFSGSGFRFSYGLMNNLEIGVSLPIDLSVIKFGAKYKLPLKGNLTLGLLGGYTTLIGNQVYDRRDGQYELTPSYVGGIIVTYKFNNRFSFDFDAQYQKHSFKTIGGHSQGLFLNADFGYYLLENIDFIVGLNYNYKNFDKYVDNSHLLSLNTGVAIERAKHFILVLNAPFDILGKNEYQTKGFGLALTILLD
jgi:hypothetical protein